MAGRAQSWQAQLQVPLQQEQAGKKEVLALMWAPQLLLWQRLELVEVHLWLGSQALQTKLLPRCQRRQYYRPLSQLLLAKSPLLRPLLAAFLPKLEPEHARS